jgi:hypothetical protein
MFNFVTRLGAGVIAGALVYIRKADSNWPAVAKQTDVVP